MTERINVTAHECMSELDGQRLWWRVVAPNFESGIDWCKVPWYGPALQRDYEWIKET